MRYSEFSSRLLFIFHCRIYSQACDWDICKKPKLGIKSPASPTIVRVERRILFFSSARLLENAFSKARKVFYSKYIYIYTFLPSLPQPSYMNLNNEKFEKFIFQKKRDPGKKPENHMPVFRFSYIWLRRVLLILKNSWTVLNNFQEEQNESKLLNTIHYKHLKSGVTDD